MSSIIRKRLKENLSIDLGCSNTICGVPRSMLLELTNACNNSCLFCANSKSTKQKGIIKTELAKRLLKEAYDWGVREVGFYGTGESLLDKNLENYISYAKELGYEYIYITTNGALLSKERADSIATAGIDSIKFSINASNRNEYLLIHGKDDFNKVMDNILYLSSLKEKFSFALYISCVVTRYNCSDKEQFVHEYQKYVDDIVFYDCLNVAGCMAYEIEKYLVPDGERGRYHVNGVCPMIFKTLHITYEGYLTMCCVDYQNYLVVADLEKEKLSDAWNNMYAQELRRRHLEHNLEGTLCFNCIENCVSKINPIREEYATIFDINMWNKSAEIEERISKYV